MLHYTYCTLTLRYKHKIATLSCYYCSTVEMPPTMKWMASTASPLSYLANIHDSFCYCIRPCKTSSIGRELHGESCYRKDVSINHYSWKYSVDWHTGSGLSGSMTAVWRIKRRISLYGGLWTTNTSFVTRQTNQEHTYSRKSSVGSYFLCVNSMGAYICGWLLFT